MANERKAKSNRKSIFRVLLVANSLPLALPSPFPSPFPFAYPFPFPIPIDIGICSRYAAGSGVLHAATQLAMKWKTKASIS